MQWLREQPLTQAAWVQIPAPPLASCEPGPGLVSLCLGLPLENEDDNSPYFIGWL